MTTTRQYTVPNFNKRHHLDKLANFCSNKVFNVAIETIMPTKVYIYLNNCEYLNKIELSMCDCGVLLCTGEVCFTEVPDTIYLKIYFPIYKNDIRKYLSQLYMEIANTVRHELQHILQLHYVNRKYIEKTCLSIEQRDKFVKDNGHVWEADKKYFSSSIEREANVKSAMYMAKKTGKNVDSSISDIFSYRIKEVKSMVRKEYWNTVEAEYKKIQMGMSDFVPKCYGSSTIFMK